MEYKQLAEIYKQLEETSKRLEKTYIVSQLLKKISVEELQRAVLLLQGRVFPPYDPRTLGVATKIIIKSISKSYGISAEKIEKDWKRTGNLGDTSEYLAGNKKQATLFSTKVTVKKVFENLKKIAAMEGSGSIDRKIGLVAELLTSATPIEARYIVRTVLEDLRVGVGDGVLRDAIVWAFFEESININYDDDKKSIDPENRETYNMYVEKVQGAYDILNDFSEVAEIAKVSGLRGLKSVSLKVGKPVKVMLYPKAKDIEDAFSIVGKPAAIEYKYDGFRMQIHIGDKIKIFTRRLEEVTQRFPEVVKYVESNVDGKGIILDAEAVGFEPKTGKYLPFQSISQRIKRKYDIDNMAKQFPVEVNVFDILMHEGNTLLEEEFAVRRRLIEKMIKQEKGKIVLAKQLVTESIEEAEKFYQESLNSGEEGVMFKNIHGIYKPGSRAGYGAKVKPVMESLDLVVVGAEWGEGKRLGWLTSLTLACYDHDTNEFKEIGKVGTGMKELEGEGVTFGQVTELLKPLIIKEKGREVEIKPALVIEINFEEIQKSPKYSSGYALRFPRVIRLREDRTADECSDIELVENLYDNQRSR